MQGPRSSIIELNIAVYDFISYQLKMAAAVHQCAIFKPAFFKFFVVKNYGFIFKCLFMMTFEFHVIYLFFYFYLVFIGLIQGLPVFLTHTTGARRPE